MFSQARSNSQLAADQSARIAAAQTLQKLQEKRAAQLAAQRAAEEAFAAEVKKIAAEREIAAELEKQQNEVSF